MHVDALFAEVLRGVSAEADKCRIFPDGSFEEVKIKPEAGGGGAHRAAKRSRADQHVGGGWVGGASAGGSSSAALSLLADVADGGSGVAGGGAQPCAWGLGDPLSLGV